MRSAADATPSFVHLPGLAAIREEGTLAGDDAHYLVRVVRVRPGERLTATDGEGLVASLAIVDVRHGEVVVRPDGPPARVPPPAPLRLLCGAPEGERGDWLVEKLAELGVTELVPLDTARGAWPHSGRRERWERLAIAALKQSRSAWRMRIADTATLAHALESSTEGVRWLGDPDGRPVHALDAGPGASITGAVGPSAGFSPDERNLLVSRGFVAARLAPFRLRTETAALAIAAAAASRRCASGGEA